MAVIIIGEDGQAFYSPPELDAFTYYRDYILKRTFAEFLQLNPGAAEEGWVDVSGQAWWELDVGDSEQDQGNVVWDGTHVVQVKANEAFSLDAKLRSWPDSPPELPWTRYLRPSRIRFTVKNAGGALITVTASGLTFDNDGEFMQAFEVGAVNLPDGLIFAVDPQQPIVGDSDHIQSIRFSYFTGRMVPGDRIIKIEFNYDPLDRVDYTNIFVEIDIPEVTSRVNFVTTGSKSDGTPVIQCSQDNGYNDYHGIWNGESWDYYYLPVTSGQSQLDIIGYDDFDNVHYIQSGTPGSFKRWSWNLSSGFYDQDIDFSIRPGDQCWNPVIGRMEAVDPDGYNHFVTRGRTTEGRYFISHYYQDASGWHHEEIFDFGDNDIENYPWFHQYCSHLDMAIDSYGKVHVFVEIVMREPPLWGQSQALGYITNSRTSGWTSQILEPWGTGVGRLDCADIYVDRENDNYLTGIIGSFQLPLLFMEKEFTATDWTYTEILPGTDHDYLQSVKIGDIYHLLGNQQQQGYYYIKMMDYLKYDGPNHEIIAEKSMYTPGALITQRQMLWEQVSYYVRDGKPILCTPGEYWNPLNYFNEQEINE
jgi:hypothetical protein